ncbi:MAG: hypothetical protein RLZZ587_180 [Actinomycetota bacterium]
MTTNIPQEPTEPTEPSENGTVSGDVQKPATEPAQEYVLRDGESVSFTATSDGTANIVVNVVPPQRSSGFFSSCFQGCGCLVIIVVVFSIIGSLIGR